jgi:hypothetical protein
LVRNHHKQYTDNHFLSMSKVSPMNRLLMSTMLLLFFLSLNLSAQKKGVSATSTRLSAQLVTEINPELLCRSWTAKWISYPDNSNTDYGV